MALYVVSQLGSQTQTADLSRLFDEELAQLDFSWIGVYASLRGEPLTK
jgi:hypothetical protein